MATENLKVKITADASQAKAEIGKFKDTLKGVSPEADKATSSIGKLATELGVLMATLKTVKAIVKNGIDVAAQGDAIKDNAQKVFMSTTAYQEWGYVLKQNGIEITALKGAMKKFSQNVANGDAALAKYGITARDIDTAFEQAISAIQNMASETDKVAAATELFGARALELMPVLNMTNQETQNLMQTYRLLGGTMSNELIAASDTCSDSITAMKAAWGGLKNLLAAYVIPVITKVVQWITIAIAYMRILLKAILGVKESFGGKGSKKNSLPSTSASVAKNTGGAAKNIKKAAKSAKELKRTLMGIDELTKLVEQATSSGSGGGGGGGGSIGDIGAGLDDMSALGDIAILDDATLEKLGKFQTKIESISGILNGVYEIFRGLVKLSFGNITGAFSDFKDGISKIWTNLKELFPSLQKLEDWWTNMKTKVASKALEFKATFSETVKTKAQALKTWWDNTKISAKTFIANFSETVKTKWNALKTWWDGLKVNAKTFATNFTDGVRQKWDDLKAWWDKRKTNAKTFTVEFKNSVKSAWDKFKKWWDKLKGGEKKFGVKFTFTDKLKSGWNSLAKKINAARDKSKVVKSLIPYIPTLARGGILTNPTTALLGEYAGARHNPEIATPQSLMYETIQRANGDMVSAFASMTRQVIAAIEGKDMTVKIGDEQIARSAQRGNTAYYNRTGKALLTI